MASDIENKQFIENVVRPFFKNDLPIILTSLAKIEMRNDTYPSVPAFTFEGEPEGESETDVIANELTVGIDAWKRNTYGG